MVPYEAVSAPLWSLAVPPGQVIVLDEPVYSGATTGTGAIGYRQFTAGGCRGCREEMLEATGGLGLAGSRSASALC